MLLKRKQEEDNKKALENERQKELEASKIIKEEKIAKIQEKEAEIIVNIVPAIKFEEKELLNKKQKANQELSLKEKAQLDVLLNKLNAHKEENKTSKEIQEKVEYYIPYYLTKEWVSSNLI